MTCSTRCKGQAHSSLDVLSWWDVLWSEWICLEADMMCHQKGQVWQHDMVGVGWGNGGSEKRRRLMKQQRNMEGGWSSAREIPKPMALLASFLPCLEARELCCDAVCERLLAASLELAQALTAVLSATQETEAAQVHLLGPAEHAYHPHSRPQPCSKKASQTAEWVESWVQ